MAIGTGLALLLSSGIGAGATWLGSRATSKGARRGAEAQMAGMDRASAMQWEMFMQTRQDMLPWLETGGAAAYTLADLMGIDMGGEKSDRFGYLTEEFTGKDLYEDPGYQFRLGEGEKSINRMAAASGGFFGGQRGKALSEYGQDLASQEYGAAFARDRASRGDLFARLAGISSGGRGGAQAVGTAGVQTGAGIGRNYMYGGQALSDMYRTQGQASQSAYTDYANIGIGGMENWLSADMRKNPGKYWGEF